MLERPEAVTLARQLNESLIGLEIQRVVVEKDPHKMAWLNENRKDYIDLLIGRHIDMAVAYGGQVELQMGESRLLVSDGVNLRLWSTEPPEKIKHQLSLKLSSGSYLTFTVQMYGGISVYLKDTNQNPYYLAAKEKLSVDDGNFSLSYFSGLAAANPKLSLKAFLATEQRIPGLGNGILQDMLFNAKLHPKTKVGSLDDEKCQGLYTAICETVAQMIQEGGRDVEVDLFGNPGGYQTKMSKANESQRCPICGTGIIKENYMGGSIYFCPACQRM